MFDRWFEALDLIASWGTLLAVVALNLTLLRNQYRGFNALDRLHRVMARLELEFSRPQPRYLISPADHREIITKPNGVPCEEKPPTKLRPIP